MITSVLEGVIHASGLPVRVTLAHHHHVRVTLAGGVLY
jgi:hypothetical protein